ncbi:MAG: hypothetical protein AB9869_09425 [Verrucomicrobiia bacterium]
MTKKTLARSLTLLWLPLAWGLLSTGCHSLTGAGSASFASVSIPGRSVAEIQAATAQVFSENGYFGGLASNGQMVFEKEGTRANTIAREGLFAAQSGAQTVVRVRADVVSLGSGSYRLQCQAFMVTGAGDSFFEEEERLANLRGAPYQALLNEVAKRLKPL